MPRICLGLLKISLLGIVAGHIKIIVAAQEVAYPVSSQVDDPMYAQEKLRYAQQAEPVSLQEAGAQENLLKIGYETVPEKSILTPAPSPKFAQVPLLTYFARYGCPEDIELALQLNPNAGVYDQFGFSALHTCLLNSCQECALAMIPLLARKVGIDYPTEKRIYALREQKDQAAVFDARKLAPYNRTALFIAAKMGKQALMQALLDAKAHINHQDSLGFTPLDMLMHGVERIAAQNQDWRAKQSHYPATVKFLYVRGAQTKVYELSHCLTPEQLTALERSKAQFMAKSQNSANQ
jgi:hypothetical protein